MKIKELTKPNKNLNTDKIIEDVKVFKDYISNAFIRRRVVFYMDSYRYASYEVKKRWGLDFLFFEAGHEQVKSVYFDDTLNQKAAAIWYEKLDTDPNFKDATINELKQIIQLQKDFAAKIPQKQMSINKLRSVFEEHLEYWVKFFSLGFLWFCCEIIKEKNDEEIKKVWKESKEDLDLFLENVYRPKGLPLSSIEQRDLLKIYSLYGTDKFKNALEEHCEKYKFLSVRDIDDPYFDMDYYEGRVKIFADKNEYQKQKDLIESADEEIISANKILEEVDIPQNLKDKIEFIRWFMYLRTESVDHMMLVNSSFKSVLNSFGSIFDLTPEEVLFMTNDEIIESLENQKLMISKEVILDRTNNGYAYLIAPNGSYLVTGQDIDVLESLIVEKKNTDNIKELKGQIAYKGKVTAKARVILDKKKANELQEGEILVTPMTMPDFVPAMKISAGIITNEGGVLCHAAIMSRELRKPCVIGTKNATSVIKTGQVITLDADNGIILLN